jgi:hypothetical protein
MTDTHTSPVTAALLPCPFCGGEAKCSSRPTGIMGQIYCDGEECFGPRTTALTKQNSIVQWNTPRKGRMGQRRCSLARGRYRVHFGCLHMAPAGSPQDRRILPRDRLHHVKAGGPGVFTQKKYLADLCEVGGSIPDAIARHNPMATRASYGCPVGCWFCIVPKMDGKTFTFLPDFPVRPVLCDDNLSALAGRLSAAHCRSLSEGRREAAGRQFRL